MSINRKKEYEEISPCFIWHGGLLSYCHILCVCTQLRAKTKCLFNFAVPEGVQDNSNISNHISDSVGNKNQS